jgi:hypothetical protein
LAQIDDCVGTLAARGPNDAQAWIRHGCGPLLANPTCAGVVVVMLQGVAEGEGFGCIAAN